MSSIRILTATTSQAMKSIGMPFQLSSLSATRTRASRSCRTPVRRSPVALFQAEIANVQKRLDSGKDSDGAPLTSERRRHLELAKANFEFWISDMKDSHQIPPGLTIADSLVLHRGERSIEIRYLGNGHTTGDLVVFLPKEKIVATGDLVVDPIPFGFSTTLHDWPATLQALKTLNATIILPGHGEIESDWTYVDRQIALFESTWQQVKQAVDGGADLQATHKQVNADALWKTFGRVRPNRETSSTMSISIRQLKMRPSKFCARGRQASKSQPPGAAAKNKKAALIAQSGLLNLNPGDDLRSHTVARAVSSAQRGLTSVFGMGTGVTLAV